MFDGDRVSLCAVSGSLSEIISGVKDTCGEVRGRLDESASQPHILAVSVYFHGTVSTSLSDSSRPFPFANTVFPILRRARSPSVESGCTRFLSAANL